MLHFIRNKQNLIPTNKFSFSEYDKSDNEQFLNCAQNSFK